MTEAALPVVFEDVVDSAWIDENHHVADYVYSLIFSKGETEFLKSIGIDAEYRLSTSCTVYTVESHICFKKEVLVRTHIKVRLQLLDAQSNKAHIFMELVNEAGDVCSHYESMLIHVTKLGTNPKSSPFPKTTHEKLKQLLADHTQLPWPVGAGRRIAIKLPGRDS